MKKFELTLISRIDYEFEVQSTHKIEADSLVELASQFAVMIAQVAQEVRDNDRIKMGEGNDSIPF